MPTSHDLELFKAAFKTVKEIIRVKEGENLLITIDSISDFRVAEEMAKSGEALGAKVMAVIRNGMGEGSNKRTYKKSDAWGFIN